MESSRYIIFIISAKLVSEKMIKPQLRLIQAAHLLVKFKCYVSMTKLVLNIVVQSNLKKILWWEVDMNFMYLAPAWHQVMLT